MVLGYEVWGSPNQVHAKARDCPDGTRASVKLDPHRDYGVIRCARVQPEKPEKIAFVIELEKDEPEPPADMVISLKDTEPVPTKQEIISAPVAPPPVVEQPRDQPRVEPTRKAKRKRKRAMRMYND
jgi:hypothetical protein